MTRKRQAIELLEQIYVRLLDIYAIHVNATQMRSMVIHQVIRLRNKPSLENDDGCHGAFKSVFNYYHLSKPYFHLNYMDTRLALISSTTLSNSHHTLFSIVRFIHHKHSSVVDVFSLFALTSPTLTPQCA